MELISVCWKDFSQGLRADKSDLVNVKKTWDQLYEKRLFAYTFWNQLHKINLQCGVRAIAPTQEEQENRIGYKANAFAFLMTYHAFIDSIPFFINKAYSLGIDDRNVGWGKDFIKKVKESEIPCSIELEDINSTDEFFILKELVSQFKHRDLPIFKFFNDNENLFQLVFEKITYRNLKRSLQPCQTVNLENQPIPDLIEKIHNTLDIKAISVFRVKSN